MPPELGLHQRQIDHQPIVAAAQAGSVIAAAPNPDEQALLAATFTAAIT